MKRSEGGARPLQIVAACRLRDLPILEIAARKLAENLLVKELHVITRDQDCSSMERALKGIAVIHSERGFIPDVSLDRLRELPIEGFPAAAGWYLQQLLKLQFAFVNPEDDYYLIWDADTIPLRPVKLFDARGRMVLTKAEEYHAPYFETYRTILGEDPRREFSFIAQHMLIQKSVAREMFSRIESHLSGEGAWAWKIMRALPSQGRNLFSEYETYGHYVRSHYPDRVVAVERQWLRDGASRSSGGIPSERLLASLGQKYDFAAFERVETRTWRRIARRIHAGITRAVRAE